MVTSKDRDDHEFWQHRALDALGDSLRAKAPSATDQPVSEELEELLMAFVEGELDEEEESHFWQLVESTPQAAKRLQEIIAAREEAAGIAPLDLLEFEREEQPKDQKPQRISPGRFDAVVRVSRKGLELLETTGRQAYAPALARAEASTPPVSAALEFLTSIGTFQVIIDRGEADSCSLTVVARHLATGLDSKEIDLDVHSDDDALLRSEPFLEGRAHVESLASGAYRLRLVTATRGTADLSIDLRKD